MPALDVQGIYLKCHCGSYHFETCQLDCRRVISCPNGVVDRSTNSNGDEQQQEPRFDPRYEIWLQKAGVQLSYRYLPRVAKDNFGTATLEKFRVYELTDYDRVYFMDSNMIPTCNIDSHFRASMDGRLQDTVVFRGTVAPITASKFIVPPKSGYFAEIMDIV